MFIKRSKFSVIASFIIGILIVSVAITGHVYAQSGNTVSCDDTEFIHDTGELPAGRLVICPNDVNGDIVFIQWNFVGEIIAERLAKPAEINFYNDQKSAFEKTQSFQSIQSGPDGQVWRNWVANRTDELQDCESDMQLGQGTAFNGLGLNNQNLAISRMQECIELNARVNRQTINGVLNLLISQGIID